MGTITGVIGILYMFVILPLLIGSAVGKAFRARDDSLNDRYIRGFECLFFVLYMTAMTASVIPKDLELERFAVLWFVLILVMGAASMYYVRGALADTYDKIKGFIRSKSLPGRKETFRWIGVCSGIILFSVMFAVPSVWDDTIELTREMMAANTIHSPEASVSFPELIYAIPAVIFHIEPAFLVHMVMPFVLLPFFFAVYHRAGKMFFYESISKQNMFFGLVLLFYGVLIFADADISMTAFSNIWNGRTLTVTCLLPLEFLVLIGLGKWIRAKRAGKEALLSEGLLWGAEFVMTAAAVQLFLHPGIVLCVFMAPFVVFVL